MHRWIFVYIYYIYLKAFLVRPMFIKVWHCLQIESF